MAEIKPFNGLLYNQEKIKDIKNVVAPPYDIISEAGRDELYLQDEHNVIRLILGKECAGDNEKENKYTRSANWLKSWIKDEVLLEDKKPAIYIYEKEYTFNNNLYIRRGFIANVKVEDYEKKVILPHEKTLSKPKEDRLNLLRACKTNFSQIFLIYSDPKNLIDSIMEKNQTTSVIELTDKEGIKHTVTPLTDLLLVEKIVSLMKDKNMYIADGHHRYETALNYRNEIRDQRTDKDDPMQGEYVMAYFANMDSPGTTIFPTHRLVKNIDGFSFDTIEEKLKEYFTVSIREIDKDQDKNSQINQCMETLKKTGQNTPSFGLYYGDNKFYTCSVKDKEKILTTFGKESSTELTLLDVNILHKIVFNDLIGIDSVSVSKQKHIVYEVNEIKAVEKVDEGQFQAVFFLNATKIDSMRKIVSAGEKMPQKSTYFYPKLKTGLVMNMIVSA